MIKVGQFNELAISRKVDFGYYLEDGNEGILLPKKYVDKPVEIGDKLNVFIYHDSDNRLIATTQKPYALAGEIALLKVVATTKQGAFLDWGLAKDLFVPVSKQKSEMKIGEYYWVKLYIDAPTGRIAATEKIEQILQKTGEDLVEKQLVEVFIYRKTEIGYSVIFNNEYLGLLHNNQVFKPLKPGEKHQGYIKNIREDGKIDVLLGKPGFQKTTDEAAVIISQLEKNKGFLPYTDKTAPEVIYEVFGMSKKTFKMTIGNLYKQHKIQLLPNGIQLMSAD